MASEILAVPEEDLQKTITVIRAGAERFNGVLGYDRVVRRLLEWCREEEDYLKTLEEES